MIYPQSVWLHSWIDTTTTDKTNNEDTILKFAVASCEHKCDYIWIIHGMENYYEKLIQQLKLNNNSKTIISSYCWVENLKDGSNRIEYLVNNKIENLIEVRVEELNDQPVLIESITITTESTQHEKKPEKTVICDFDGCKKKFKNANAMKDHQLAKHPSVQPAVIHDEITITMTEASTITNSQKATKKPKMTHGCEHCRLSYKKLRDLQKHQIEQHSIPLRCLFSKECLESDGKYLGVLNLQNHILSQHADSFSQSLCPIAQCKNKNYWSDWFAALEHIKNKHRNYLLDDFIPRLTSETKASVAQTKPTTNILSWDLGDQPKYPCNHCDRSYQNEVRLQLHAAFEHPVRLSCPFGSECQQSTRKYIGRWNLRKHLYLKHVPHFSQPMCFDSECKEGEKKPFKNWDGVLRHILKKHLEAVGIIIESTTTLPKETRGISKKCSYSTCNQFFETRKMFQHHLVTYHPFPLRCPYNSECNKLANDVEAYLGLMELEIHIETVHSEQFSKPMCFNSQCQKEKHHPDWNAVMQHILTKHWLDIKSN